MKNIVLKPISFDAELDIMKISEWIASVELGAFIDYDGFGYLATDKDESNLRVCPSYVLNEEITKVSIDFEEPEDTDQEKIKQFTHIVWYNR